MPNEQPIDLQFQCGRCDARLTVKKMLAGRKINCPKCHKKIQVPNKDNDVATVPEDLATMSPRGVNNNTPSTFPPGGGAQAPAAASGASSGNGKAAPAPPPEDASASRARIEEQERQLAKRQTEVEGLERELEAERKRQAEKTASLQTDVKNLSERLQAARDEAERRGKQVPDPTPGNDEALEQARRRIAELERQVTVSQRQARPAAPAARPGDPSAAAPEEDETEGPDPDQLIAHLQNSTLRRGLRLSLLAHALFLLLTSLGFLYWTVRGGRPEPETAADGETPAAVQPAETEAPVEAAEQTPDTRPEAPPDTVEPPDTVAERPRSSIEEEIESLPEPGETPEPSDVTLDFD